MTVPLKTRTILSCDNYKPAQSSAVKVNGFVNFVQIASRRTRNTSDKSIKLLRSLGFKNIPSFAGLTVHFLSHHLKMEKDWHNSKQNMVVQLG